MVVGRAVAPTLGGVPWKSRMTFFSKELFVLSIANILWRLVLSLFNAFCNSLKGVGVLGEWFPFKVIYCPCWLTNDDEERVGTFMSSKRQRLVSSAKKMSHRFLTLLAVMAVLVCLTHAAVNPVNYRETTVNVPAFGASLVQADFFIPAGKFLP